MKVRSLILPIISALLVFTITGMIVHSIYKDKKDEERYQQYFEEIPELGRKYNSLMQEMMPPYFEDMDYYQRAEVTGSLKYVDNPGEKKDELERYYKVVVYVDNEFDLLSDDDQYDYLYEVISAARAGECHVRANYIPDMDTIFDELPEFVYRYKGKIIYTPSNSDYSVKTENNTYSSIGLVDDYFILNGKEHFTERYRRLHNMDNSDSTDESKTYSEPKYSGKTKIYNDFDPDDPDTYDDPEDYWDEYGDYEDEEEWDY